MLRSNPLSNCLRKKARKQMNRAINNAREENCARELGISVAAYRAARLQEVLHIIAAPKPMPAWGRNSYYRY